MVWVLDDYYDREHRGHYKAELGHVLIFFLLAHLFYSLGYGIILCVCMRL
jgi:hypothetical protein